MIYLIEKHEIIIKLNVQYSLAVYILLFIWAGRWLDLLHFNIYNFFLLALCVIRTNDTTHRHNHHWPHTQHVYLILSEHTVIAGNTECRTPYFWLTVLNRCGVVVAAYARWQHIHATNMPHQFEKSTVTKSGHLTSVRFRVRAVNPSCMFCPISKHDYAWDILLIPLFHSLCVFYANILRIARLLSHYSILWINSNCQVPSANKCWPVEIWLSALLLLHICLSVAHRVETNNTNEPNACASTLLALSFHAKFFQFLLFIPPTDSRCTLNAQVHQIS